MTSNLPPLSIYVHLPWCVRKCPYCDFNSHRLGRALPGHRYVQALLRDLETESAVADERVVQSIFLGGGTPSLFSPDEIAQLINGCRQNLRLHDDCEISMEANPGTIERGALAGYRDAGVNRLSLGAQSFDPEMLQALGRIHSSDDIVRSFNEACAAEFESINLDLMFALPGQTLEKARTDVETLLALGPPHASYYQLTLEPNTVYFQRPPAGMPDDDLAWDMQLQGHELLRDAGYSQYEISAFARAGHRCRHNLNYWSFGDYLAIGAGAHGKITTIDLSILRYQKPANPLLYMEWAETDAREIDRIAVAGRDISFEFLLNALRMTDGFLEAEFEARTGVSWQSIGEPLRQAVADGLIEAKGSSRWRATARGLRYLNDLQARFLG